MLSFACFDEFIDLVGPEWKLRLPNTPVADELRSREPHKDKVGDALLLYNGLGNLFGLCEIGRGGAQHTGFQTVRAERVLAECEPSHVWPVNNNDTPLLGGVTLLPRTIAPSSCRANMFMYV